MTYAWTQDVPINMAMYDRIKAKIGTRPPDGFILHVVSRTDTGLRYFDVWESEAACDHFFEDRVHPAVGAVFSEMGLTFPAVEPARTIVDVTDVWIPSMLEVGT